MVSMNIDIGGLGGFGSAGFGKGMASIGGLAIGGQIGMIIQGMQVIGEHLKKLTNILQEVSPALKGSFDLLKRSFQFALKPIADAFGIWMLPMAKMLMKLASKWLKFTKETGIFEDLPNKLIGSLLPAGTLNIMDFFSKGNKLKPENLVDTTTKFTLDITKIINWILPKINLDFSNFISWTLPKLVLDFTKLITVKLPEIVADLGTGTSSLISNVINDITGGSSGSSTYSTGTSGSSKSGGSSGSSKPAIVTSPSKSVGGAFYNNISDEVKARIGLGVSGGGGSSGAG
jgi:hypothetical protein